MLKRLRLLASFVFCTTVAALQSQLNPVRADHVCDDIQTHCNNYCQNPEAVENCEFFALLLGLQVRRGFELRRSVWRVVGWPARSADKMNHEAVPMSRFVRHRRMRRSSSAGSRQRVVNSRGRRRC